MLIRLSEGVYSSELLYTDLFFFHKMPFSSHANSYSFKHSKSMLLIATTIKKNQIIISRTSNVSKLLSTIYHTSKARNNMGDCFLACHPQNVFLCDFALKTSFYLSQSVFLSNSSILKIPQDLCEMITDINDTGEHACT